MTTCNGQPKRGTHTHTTAQVMLLAAYRLEEEHRAQWSAGDIAVTAARIAPGQFCLKSADGHYYNHPSDNRCIVALVDKRPGQLRARGWVEKVRPGVYRLTDLGRQEAAVLVGSKKGR